MPKDFSATQKPAISVNSKLGIPEHWVPPELIRNGIAWRKCSSSPIVQIYNNRRHCIGAYNGTPDSANVKAVWDQLSSGVLLLCVDYIALWPRNVRNTQMRVVEREIIKGEILPHAESRDQHCDQCFPPDLYTPEEIAAAINLREVSV